MESRITKSIRLIWSKASGDIGESAPIVEKNLETNFQLAHKWGCVLLVLHTQPLAPSSYKCLLTISKLDEANVFLAKRTGSDMQRNSLVSGRSPPCWPVI